MKEYTVNYKINGIKSTYYVTISEADLSYNLVRPTIILCLKKHLKLKTDDDLEIIEIT